MGMSRQEVPGREVNRVRIPPDQRKACHESNAMASEAKVPRAVQRRGGDVPLYASGIQGRGLREGAQVMWPRYLLHPSVPAAARGHNSSAPRTRDCRSCRTPISRPRLARPGATVPDCFGTPGIRGQARSRTSGHIAGDETVLTQGRRSGLPLRRDSRSEPVLRQPRHEATASSSAQVRDRREKPVEGARTWQNGKEIGGLSSAVEERLCAASLGSSGGGRGRRQSGDPLSRVVWTLLRPLSSFTHTIE